MTLEIFYWNQGLIKGCKNVKIYISLMVSIEKYDILQTEEDYQRCLESPVQTVSDHLLINQHSIICLPVWYSFTIFRVPPQWFYLERRTNFPACENDAWNSSSNGMLFIWGFINATWFAVSYVIVSGHFELK